MASSTKITKVFEFFFIMTDPHAYIFGDFIECNLDLYLRFFNKKFEGNKEYYRVAEYSAEQLHDPEDGVVFSR